MSDAAFRPWFETSSRIGLTKLSLYADKQAMRVPKGEVERNILRALLNNHFQYYNAWNEYSGEHRICLT